MSRLAFLLILATSHTATGRTPQERLAALETAAQGGDPAATAALARALQLGEGVPIDLPRSRGLRDATPANPEHRCLEAFRLEDAAYPDGPAPDSAAATRAIRAAAAAGSRYCANATIWAELAADDAKALSAEAEALLARDADAFPATAALRAGLVLAGWRPGDIAAARDTLSAIHASARATEDHYALRVMGRVLKLLQQRKPDAVGRLDWREPVTDCAALDSVVCMLMIGGELDHVDSARWLDRAIALGSVEAKGLRGLQQVYGRGGAPEVARGAALLREAVQGGDPSSAIFLARALVFEVAGVSAGADARTEARRLLAPFATTTGWEVPGAWHLLWLLDAASDQASARQAAYQWLARAAAAGHADAQADLGLEREAAGPLGPADPVEANRLYALASDQGLQRASVFLANNLLRGVGAAADPKKAESLYRSAIAAGLVEAHYRLGTALAWGWLGRPADPVEGRALLEKAAGAGHADAMVELGELSATSAGADLTAAHRWYLKAAEGGSLTGAHRVAADFADGAGVEASPTEALKWYGIAAAGNLPGARVALGRRLLEGEGVPADPQRGLALLEAAVGDNLDGAREALARALIDGTGVQVDTARGVALVREAAATESAEGLFLLALLEERGIGLPASLPEARRLYLKAAELGHAEAALNGGSMVLDGEGGPQDPVLAVRLLSLAADDGYYRAQLRLGWCYIDGLGVAVDRARGTALVRSAAEGGYADAQNDLAVLLAQDDSSPAVHKEAAAWLQRAHDGGSVHGTTGLGVALLSGDGVAAAPERGVALLQQALAAGHGPAGIHLAQHYLAQQPPQAEEARRALERAVALGDPDADSHLVDLHAADGALPDRDKERSHLVRCAKAMQPACLGLVLRRFPDVTEAAEWVIEGAEAGALGPEVVAALLGAHLLDSVRERAVKFVRQAALAASPELLAQLGSALVVQPDARVRDEGCSYVDRASAAGMSETACVVAACRAMHAEADGLEPVAAALRQCAKQAPGLASNLLLEPLLKGVVQPADAGEIGRMLEANVASGDGRYGYELACAKLRGSYGFAVDAEVGMHLLLAEAEKGDHRAEYLYAAYLYDGAAATRDPATAARWFRRAADSGSLSAKNYLALQLFDGDGVTADAREAAKLADEPARDGMPEAAYVLGATALWGLDRSKDRAEAEKWLLVAAEQGYRRACFDLARLYFQSGDGVEADPVRALAWIWVLEPDKASGTSIAEIWQRAEETAPRESLEAAKSLGDELRRAILERAAKRSGE